MNCIKPQNATQLIQILEFLPQEYFKKIPEEEIAYLNKIKDEKYNIKIEKIEDIIPEQIEENTKRYLAYIFLKYLANEEEKVEYEILINENEKRYQQILQESYDITKVLKERKDFLESHKQETELMVIKEQNFFEIILQKLKKLLKKKRE